MHVFHSAIVMIAVVVKGRGLNAMPQELQVMQRMMVAAMVEVRHQRVQVQVAYQIWMEHLERRV